MRHRLSTAGTLAVGVSLVAVVGVIALPLVRLAQSAGLTATVRAWTGQDMPTVAWHTVLLACTVAVVAVLLGTAIALFLARPEMPLRRTLRVAVVLPLIVPQFVLGYSWSQAYGRGGFTDTVAGWSWAGLLGPAGVAVVLIVDLMPVTFLLVTAALATRGQPDLEQAARLCGASAWTALRTVTLPLLRPVLASAAVLTFVATLDSFAVPQVLGTPAGFATVTTRIYADISLGSDPATFDQALALALGLVVVAAVILLPADLVLTPRLRARRTGQPAAAGGVSRRGWRGWTAAGALAIYLVAAVALPAVALLGAAITPAVGVTPTPGNWTLANFRTLLTAATGQQLLHSVELAALSASILAVLSVLAVALVHRRTGQALTTVVTLTFAVPGSALAVGMLVVYNRWLGGTLTLILLAYLGKLWALAIRPVSGAIDRISAAERQAAQLSGARPLTVLRTIVLPALLPTVAGGWLLVFVTALHEVTMSSLLYSTGSETLAVAVLNSEELGNVGATAALSVLLTLLVFLGALPLWGLLRAGARLRAPRPSFGTPMVANAA
jgi:iron(III) transport system permease protein